MIGFKMQLMNFSPTFSRHLSGKLFLIALVGGCASHPQVTTRVSEPFPSATPARVVDVTQKVFPAVVRLDVAQEIFVAGKRTLQRGIGSGFIIDDQGHVLTNYHVAGRAVEINITLSNKERVPAKLIGDDHWTDLAVVQIDMDVMRARKIPFNFTLPGDSDTLAVGQDVIAIGTPFGLARTMTLGIVSNNERTFYPDIQKIDEYETGLFNNWIQMDTPIAPGNSGGPLVDLDGKIVGINTRGIQGQALNFAIPINTAKQVVASILATASPTRAGRVDRSDLGIDLKPLQDLESFYNIDINQGVLVNSVDRNSPAARAGVRTQDILLAIDGAPVNVRFPEEVASVRKRIADEPIGKTLVLTVRRGKDVLQFKAITDKLEGYVGEEKGFDAWGVTVREVTRAYANDEQLDDDTGVVVTTFSPGSPAARAELASGDVIRSVNGKDVSDLTAFQALFTESTDAKDDRVLLEIQRGRAKRSAVLKVTY